MVIKNHGFTALIMLLALLHAYAGMFFNSFGMWIVALVIAFCGIITGLVICDHKGDVEWHVTRKKN